MSSNGSEKTEELKQDLEDLKRRARQQAEDARKEVVKHLNKAAETIRREVREGKAADDADTIARADSIASNLEKTATYLNTHSVEQMGQEATRVVVKNPWGAVAAALVIGFILGLIMRGGGRD